jgi:hypothetical protein
LRTALPRLVRSKAWSDYAGAERSADNALPSLRRFFGNT